MLLATRGLWVTSGILWSCCTWIQFLFFFFFLPFCLVELSGNCWSQNNSICREGYFGVGAYIINYTILLTTLLSIPWSPCLQEGSCFLQCPLQAVLEEQLFASLSEQRFGGKGCSAREWAVGLCFLAELLPRTICLRDWLCQCSSFREGILTLRVLCPGLGPSCCLHVCPSAPSYVLQK